MNLNLFITKDAKKMTYGEFKKNIGKISLTKSEAYQQFTSIIVKPFSYIIKKENFNNFIDIIDGCKLVKLRSENGKYTGESFLINREKFKNNKLDINELDAWVMCMYRENNKLGDKDLPMKTIDQLSMKTIIDCISKFFKDCF